MLRAKTRLSGKNSKCLTCGSRRTPTHSMSWIWSRWAAQVEMITFIEPIHERLSKQSHRPLYYTTTSMAQTASLTSAGRTPSTVEPHNSPMKLMWLNHMNKPILMWTQVWAVWAPPTSAHPPNKHMHNRMLSSCHNSTSQQSLPGRTYLVDDPTPLFKICSQSSQNRKWRLRSSGNGSLASLQSLMQWTPSGSSMRRLVDKSPSNSYPRRSSMKSASNLRLTSSIFSSCTSIKKEEVPWSIQNFVMPSCPSHSSASKSSSLERHRTWKIWKRMNKCSLSTRGISTDHYGTRYCTQRCLLSRSVSCYSRIRTLTSRRPSSSLKARTKMIKVTASSQGTISPERSCCQTHTLTFFSINSIDASLAWSTMPR